MAVGDVVNGIGVLSTPFTFQPASGVEIMISIASVYTSWTYLYNGTTQSEIWQNLLTTSGQNYGNAPEKIFINNTNYLRINNDPSHVAHYTGIQIK